MQSFPSAPASTAAEELERLLAENEEQAAARAVSRLVIDGSEAFALYGAGTLGRTVLASLRKAGIEPAAFADDTPAKQGQRVEGVEIMTPSQVVERHGDKAVFIVTILNPLLRFADARTRLERLGATRVLSFLDVAWRFPESFLPYYQFELPQQLLTKRAAIRRAFDALGDEESRRQFAAHLRFRLHLDYDALPANAREDYFPQLLPPLARNVVYVDCGAFDGDTVRRFLAEQGETFSQVHAFEPDARNAAALRRYVASLPPHVAERIVVHEAAVGAGAGKLTFNQTGNMSAALSSGGGVTVDVVALDDVVPRDRGPVYLKFDVEGGEWEGLAGARSLIDETRPMLALSIYHRPDDLWELPLWVHDLGLGYDIFLRTQGEDGMDVICYAIPR